MKRIIFTLCCVTATWFAISQNKSEQTRALPVAPTNQVVVLRFCEGGYSTGTGTNYVYHYAEMPVYLSSSSPGAPTFENMTIPPTKPISFLATDLAQLSDLGFHIVWQSENTIMLRKP